MEWDGPLFLIFHLSSVRLLLNFFFMKLLQVQKIVLPLQPQSREKATKEKLNGALVQLVRIHACHAWGHGFESRTHRLRKKTEIRKSKTISSKSVTLGIFFCYTTTDEYPVGSRKLDKSSNQIVTKKKKREFWLRLRRYVVDLSLFTFNFIDTP